MRNTNLKFKVLRYFSYTSIVTDKICKYRERQDEGEPNAMLAYEDCVRQAKERTSHDYKDNKSAFEILCNNRILYVGYYDGEYSIGLGISGIGGNVVIDFLTGERLPYGNHDA